MRGKRDGGGSGREQETGAGHGRELEFFRGHKFERRSDNTLTGRAAPPALTRSPP